MLVWGAQGCGGPLAQGPRLLAIPQAATAGTLVSCGQLVLGVAGQVVVVQRALLRVGQLHPAVGEGGAGGGCAIAVAIAVTGGGPSCAVLGGL